jgi:hypothetical protein
MAKDRPSQARQALVRLREESPELFGVFFERGPLLKGYLDSKPRTCGTPGCRCTRGEKHAAWVLRIPEGHGSRSRSIPEGVYRRLQPLAQEYRRFRQALCRWRRLMRQADQALRDIEESRLVDWEKELRRSDEKKAKGRRRQEGGDRSVAADHSQ